MGNYKTVHFKVLPDNCSAEDQLEDRTHERIADKLYEIISTDGSEGMTIGLEGEWGAGKSTVIRLLQERLKAEKKSKTFVFYIDAWEHEGDHLRRVFLEMLISCLQKYQQTQKHVRALKLINDKVTAKRATKFITHRARLSCFGKLLAFSAIFVPVGSVIVSKLFDEVTINREAPFHKGFCCGLIMLLAPLWVYVLEFFRCITCWLFSLFKQESAAFNGWAVFDSKARVDRVMETSLSDERSSVEFSRYFDEIMDVVQNEIDRVVIIIDNLDRIDSKDAACIWSTLQAFVQNKNPIMVEDKKLCKWIIVPYAQEGLSKIWAEGESGRPLSFMDKSFQLRLHVPKMVISSWKGFARKCIGEAAPSLDAEDSEKMLNVLSWTRDNLTDAPSPRQIKIYINQVGIACSLHGNRVPLEAICFYVVKKYLNGLSDTQLEDDLRDKNISAASLPQYSNCYELSAEVAAILYGVEEDKAMQILLAPIITESLRTSKSDELGVMEEMHKDVFYDVLDYILKCSESNWIPRFVASIQKAFPESNTKAHNSALNALRLNRDVAVEQMQSTVHEDAIAIIELASTDINKDLVRNFAKAYVLDLPKRFRSDGGISPRLDQKVEYIDSPAKLVKYFADVSLSAKEKITIPYKSFKDENVDFSKFSAEELKQLGGYMSNVDVAEEDIAGQIIEGKPIPGWVGNLFVALTSNGLTATHKVVGAITRAFAWTNGQRGDNIYGPIYWDVLLSMEFVDKAYRPIEEIKNLILAKGFWFFNKFPNNQTVFLLAKYHGELTDQQLVPKGLPPNIGNNGKQYTQTWNVKNRDRGLALYQYISYSHEFDWLAREATKPNRALVGSIVEAALDAKDTYLFKVEQPFRFFVNLFGQVDEAYHQMLVENFVSSEELLSKMAGSNAEKIVAYPKVCKRLLEAIKRHDVRNSIIHKIESELNDLTQAEWSAAFKASNGLAELVGLLVQEGKRLNLANPFSDAFKDFVNERIKGDLGCNLSLETLEALHRAMKPVLQSVFATGLGDVLNSVKFKIATTDIKEFVLIVPDYKDWLASSTVSVKNMAAELSKVEHVTAFDNLIAIIQRCGTILPNKEEIKDVIEQPVMAMIKSDNAGVRQVGNAAAMCFGIEVNKYRGDVAT